MKKISLKKAAPIFASLLLPVKYPSPPLLPFSDTKKKQSFDMAFNLDCRPLANDHIRKDVNLSFACYQYLLAVKANKLCQ